MCSGGGQVGRTGQGMPRWGAPQGHSDGQGGMGGGGLPGWNGGNNGGWGFGGMGGMGGYGNKMGGGDQMQYLMQAMMGQRRPQMASGVMQSQIPQQVNDTAPQQMQPQIQPQWNGGY